MPLSERMPSPSTARWRDAASGAAALAAQVARRPWIRVAGSVLILALVLWLIDVGAVVDRVRTADVGLLLLSGACLVGVLAIGAVRFLVLLRASAVTSSARVAGRSYALGTFANTFLPSAVGGDAVRILTVARSATSLRRALAVVFLDRGIGLAGMVLVAWAGVLAPGHPVPRSIV